MAKQPCIAPRALPFQLIDLTQGLSIPSGGSAYGSRATRSSGITGEGQNEYTNLDAIPDYTEAILIGDQIIASEKTAATRKLYEDLSNESITRQEAYNNYSNILIGIQGKEVQQQYFKTLAKGSATNARAYSARIAPASNDYILEENPETGYAPVKKNIPGIGEVDLTYGLNAMNIESNYGLYGGVREIKRDGKTAVEPYFNERLGMVEPDYQGKLNQLINDWIPSAASSLGSKDKIWLQDVPISDTEKRKMVVTLQTNQENIDEITNSAWNKIKSDDDAYRDLMNEWFHEKNRAFTNPTTDFFTELTDKKDIDKWNKTAYYIYDKENDKQYKMYTPEELAKDKVTDQLAGRKIYRPSYSALPGGYGETTGVGGDLWWQRAVMLDDDQLGWTYMKEDIIPPNRLAFIKTRLASANPNMDEVNKNALMQNLLDGELSKLTPEELYKSTYWKGWVTYVEPGVGLTSMYGMYPGITQPQTAPDTQYYINTFTNDKYTREEFLSKWPTLLNKMDAESVSWAPEDITYSRTPKEAYYVRKTAVPLSALQSDNASSYIMKKLGEGGETIRMPGGIELPLRGMEGGIVVGPEYVTRNYIKYDEEGYPVNNKGVQTENPLEWVTEPYYDSWFIFSERDMKSGKIKAAIWDKTQTYAITDLGATGLKANNVSALGKKLGIVRVTSYEQFASVIPTELLTSQTEEKVKAFLKTHGDELYLVRGSTQFKDLPGAYKTGSAMIPYSAALNKEKNKAAAEFYKEMEDTYNFNIPTQQ